MILVGENFSKPKILQSNFGLSSINVLAVINIPSFLDLNICEVFLEYSFVIVLDFIFLIKLSLDVANFAVINGIFFFLFFK